MVEFTLRRAFYPDMQRVASLRCLQGKCARAVGDGKPGSCQRDHHRAHRRMDVAKDIGNTRVRKPYLSRAARLVQAQIEALAFKEGKDVMKVRILVRKRDQTSSRNHEQMRQEHLVLLHELVGVLTGCRPEDRLAAQRLQPKYGGRQLCRTALPSRRQIKMCLDQHHCILRRHRSRHLSARSQGGPQGHR